MGKKITKVDGKQYDGLLTGLTELLEQSRGATARAVNSIMTATYWEIGRRIFEFEQDGEDRAAYGKEIVKKLAKDLKSQFGRGFSFQNVYQMRSFYLIYREIDAGASSSQKFQTLSGKFKDTENKDSSSPDDGSNLPHNDPSSPDKGLSSPESLGVWDDSDLRALAQPARDNKRLDQAKAEQIILALCNGRYLTHREIAALLERNPQYVKDQFISRLVKAGKLQLKFEDATNPTQAYMTVENKPE